MTGRFVIIFIFKATTVGTTAISTFKNMGFKVSDIYSLLLSREGLAGLGEESQSGMQG
jgi:hypothetical protein